MPAVVLPSPLVYPERHAPRETKLDRAASRVAGAVSAACVHRRARALSRMLEPLEAAGTRLRGLDDAGLLGEARVARAGLRAAAHWPADALVPALAVVRETAARVLGLRPFDAQMLAAGAALRGMAAEMATGEGKTMAAAIAACVAGLGGVPVHLVTVNRYLAERDAAEMAQLYGFLGLSCGVVTEAVPPSERATAYRRDITVCTNKDVAFDYMRDRLTIGRRRSNLRRKVAQIVGAAAGPGTLMRGLHFAIVDEADSVLVDEARTPLILAMEQEDRRDIAAFDAALDIASTLRQGHDFVVHAHEQRVVLLPDGHARLDALAERGPPWDETAERTRLILLALTALHTLRRDEHYLVRDGHAAIIDEFSGRTMADRSWSDGLQEMVERKEGLDLTKPRATIARTTYQRFYRRYRHLSGMSGTLREVAAELWHVYRLPVAAIPLHRPDRKQQERPLAFATAAEKWQAIAGRAGRLHADAMPVLIGTRTLDASLRASGALQADGLAHVMLNAAQDAGEAAVIAAAGGPGAVTVATNMAGRGTDIRLRAGVAEAGGLCVIVSEPHEARRIDRQLAGRCGRQGDPGLVLRFVSLEDALLRLHCPALLRGLARGVPGAWRALVIRGLARLAQARAERLHCRMRADLLNAEEWLGDAMAFAGEDS